MKRSERHLCKRSGICLRDFFKTSWRRVGKTSWKRLEDVWPRRISSPWSRRLEDVFWRRRRKTSSCLHQDECLLGSLFHNFIYLSLLNSFLLLSRFSVFLKSLSNYFCRWLACKSLLCRFLVLINYTMWSSFHFLYSSITHVFHGPGFARSRFFRVQFFQGLDFSGSGSRVQVHALSQGFWSSSK